MPSEGQSLSRPHLRKLIGYRAQDGTCSRQIGRANFLEIYDRYISSRCILFLRVLYAACIDTFSVRQHSNLNFHSKTSIQLLRGRSLEGYTVELTFGERVRKGPLKILARTQLLCRDLYITFEFRGRLKKLSIKKLYVFDYAIKANGVEIYCFKLICFRSSAKTLRQRFVKIQFDVWLTKVSKTVRLEDVLF